jgi:hypothetical protein
MRSPALAPPIAASLILPCKFYPFYCFILSSCYSLLILLLISTYSSLLFFSYYSSSSYSSLLIFKLFIVL